MQKMNYSGMDRPGVWGPGVKHPNWGSSPSWVMLGGGGEE